MNSYRLGSSLARWDLKAFRDLADTACSLRLFHRLATLDSKKCFLVPVASCICNFFGVSSGGIAESGGKHFIGWADAAVAASIEGVMSIKV